jgi:hypothetical protein
MMADFLQGCIDHIRRGAGRVDMIDDLFLVPDVRRSLKNARSPIYGNICSSYP